MLLQIPCLQTFIGNGCGSPTDWACGCSLTNGSYMNFGCYTAVVECTSYQVVGESFNVQSPNHLSSPAIKPKSTPHRIPISHRPDLCNRGSISCYFLGQAGSDERHRRDFTRPSSYWDCQYGANHDWTSHERLIT